MPAPSEFRAETVIEAGIDEVYAFHENPHNIGQISPGWQRVEILAAQPRAAAGEHFVIKIRFFGVLPLTWEGVWHEADRPNVLVDGSVRGPFAYWRHEHSFRAIDSTHTMMTDEVHYAFFRGWIGKIFGETVGRLQFRLMFADRQARTRRRLREQR